MLSVSTPFHSKLMAPAADAMREALALVEKRRPVVPVVSNVTARAEDDPDRIASLLVQQVTGRVRWRESIEFLSARGVSTLCEVGSGKVLSGLARRIDRDVTTMAIGTPAEVQSALAALS